MKLVVKGQEGIPLVLNDKGVQDWLLEHPVTLPEVTVTANKPLTDLQYRDIANGVKLGRLKDDSESTYRHWLLGEHKMLQNDIAAGNLLGQFAGALMSALTLSNPATMYAYAPLGFMNLSHNVNKIENDINTGLYLGAAADAVLTGAEFIPAGAIASNGYKAAVNYRRAIDPIYDFKKNVDEAVLPVKVNLNVGWAPKQTIAVSHASNSNAPLSLFYPSRYDVVKEGANPFGIWYLGNLGTPRTALTNGVTKGEMAEKAREVFANRPFLLKGNLTLDKPLLTIGEVSDRAALGHKAELMGADGIIYNGVYDNGYNNNQVIFSLKLADLKIPELNSHLQGADAVKMFKEYGGTAWPKGSINGEQLMRYVPEARERYGLIGNTDITDEEIAQALYKHTLELGGNTKAVNAQGEPQLLFRGDTRDYTTLRTNHSLAGGTADNILGTMFLDRTGIGEGWGPDRYLYLANKNGEVLAPYRTGIETEYYNALKPVFKDGYVFPFDGKGMVIDDDIGYKYYDYATRRDNIVGSKIVNSAFADNNANRLNGFIVRTPNVRDITYLVQTAGLYRTPNEGESFLWLIPKELRIGTTLKDALLQLHKEILKDAQLKQLGLLRSRAHGPYRDEHSDYDYMVVPDFNALNVKHILPYDLRIPRNWLDPNIFKGIIGVGILGTSLNYMLPTNSSVPTLIE